VPTRGFVLPTNIVKALKVTQDISGAWPHPIFIHNWLLDKIKSMELSQVILPYWSLKLHFAIRTLSLDALLEKDPILPLPTLCKTYDGGFCRDFVVHTDVNSTSGDSGTSHTS